jgi:hypothetical protein
MRAKILFVTSHIDLEDDLKYVRYAVKFKKGESEKGTFNVLFLNDFYLWDSWSGTPKIRDDILDLLDLGVEVAVDEKLFRDIHQNRAGSPIDRERIEILRLNKIKLVNSYQYFAHKINEGYQIIK